MTDEQTNSELPIDLCENCLKFYNCELAKKNEEAGIVPQICSERRGFHELPNKSLKDVYDVFLGWLPNLDTTRLDTRLAWYISNEYGLGNPLWVFELARSGLTKSTLSNAFSTAPKVIEMDQLTPRALISGLEVVRGKERKPARDIGMRLQGRNRCGIVSETASLKAMQQGDQRETFATLKSLHDGRIKRDTGSGVSKNYTDCNTSLWFNSTPDFRKNTIINQEMGTCYLVDVILLDMSTDEADSRTAMKNKDKLEVIKKETQYVVNCYLAHHHLIKNYKLTDEEENFIVKEANRLKYLRATGSYDNIDELTYIPEPEMPARLSTQLAKMYVSLISLDKNYDYERAKKIIRRVVDGSGDPILVKILEFIDALCWNNWKSRKEIIKFTVSDIFTVLGLGTGTIKQRLELLRGLGFLEKDLRFSGEKGGRPGYQYFLKSSVNDDTWQLLFRRDILRDRDN